MSYVSTETLLRLGVARSRVEAVAAHLNAALARYGIADTEDVAMLVANMAHESARFNAAREGDGGKYAGSRAHFESEYGYTTARNLRRRQRENTLSNTQPGDGFRFRGAGWLQLTWRDQFQAFQDYVNSRLHEYGLSVPVDFTSSDAAADQVGRLPWACESAFWFQFVRFGHLTRMSLQQKNYLMLCFVTNHTPSAERMAQGRGPEIPLPNGWSDRVQHRNEIRAPLQQDYLAFQRRQLETPKLPTLPPVFPVPVISTAGMNTNPIGDLLRVFGIRIPGLSTTSQFTAGGASLFTGQPIPAAGSPSLVQAVATTNAQQPQPNDLLSHIKQEHIIALLLLGFALSRPARRKELLNTPRRKAPS